MKRVNLSWTDGRDVHFPIDEPNPAHIESSSEENRVLTFKENSWLNHK